jgi:hypothetical protein
LLHVAPHHVIHPRYVEGSVLLVHHPKFAVNLPQQEAAFEKLEGEVVELKDAEVAPHEEGIAVRLQLPAGDFGEGPTDDFYDEARDVEGEEVDDFVDGGSASKKIAAEEVQDVDEIVR